MSLNSNVSGTPQKLGPVIRLIVALLLTAGLLTYTWARVVVFAGLTGQPPLPFVLLLVVTILAIMLLTAGLSRALPDVRWTRLVGLILAASWLGVNAVLIWLFNGPLMSTSSVLAAFVPGTLWVAWMAWMLYWPLTWSVRLGVLLLGFLLFASSQLLIRVEGLTGDAHVDFAWRWQRSASSEDAGSVLLEGVDLSQTTASDFAQYMGPDRLGILSTASLAPDWTTQCPRLLWRQSVGAGWGAFAVVGDYALTQEQRGPQECVVCYRITDGAIAWLHADPVRFDSSLGGPGPRATPTIVGGRVYSIGATGVLNCLDGATGKAFWSVNILEGNQGQMISHGVCGSPLVIENLVIVCPTGSDKASLVAYDRESGKSIWQAGGQPASYGSPLVAELDGVKQILIHAGQGVAGHEIATGRRLWFFEWCNQEGINCSQPIANAGGPGQVFAASGYGKGAVLIRVAHRSDGEWSTEKLWDSRLMKTKFTTAVVREGHVYGLDDGILACIDIKDGKKRWKDGRYQHGQILLAGNMLLVQAEDGAVVMVEPSPGGLKELGRIPALTGKTWNNPVLAGKRLLVRNDHEAACYELP